MLNSISVKALKPHQAVNSFKLIAAPIVVAAKVGDDTAVEIGIVAVAFGMAKGFRMISVALRISSV